MGPASRSCRPGIRFPAGPRSAQWLSYGLGSSNHDLPSFVVMISQGRGQMQALFSHLWGAGFLPGEHQGVQFRAASDPVLFLNDPAGMHRQDRRKVLDMIGELNRREAERNGDSEVLARVAQYEMAYRMQTSVPELTDFRNESAATLNLYGPDVHKPGTLCLQLPDGAPHGRTRRSLHPALPSRLGSSRQRSPRSAAPMPGRRSAASRPDCAISVSADFSMRRSSSGAANLAARSSARESSPKRNTAAITIRAVFACGWPAEASNPASLTAKPMISRTTSAKTP